MPAGNKPGTSRASAPSLKRKSIGRAASSYNLEFPLSLRGQKMHTLPDQTARKPAPKKAAKKTAAKKSTYEKLKSNGWGGLLKTFDTGTIDKLKAM